MVSQVQALSPQPPNKAQIQVQIGNEQMTQLVNNASQPKPLIPEIKNVAEGHRISSVGTLGTNPVLLTYGNDPRGSDVV